MEIKVTKKQMSDILVVRTYLTALSDVLDITYDTVDQIKQKDKKLNKQSKELLNPIADSLKDLLSRYAGAYQQMMNDLASEHGFTFNQETIIKIDVDNEVFIVSDGDSNINTNEQESGQ